MFTRFFGRKKSGVRSEAVAVVTSSGRTVMDANELLNDASVRRFLNRVDNRIEAARKRKRVQAEIVGTR